jgi:methanogenic corrinoid protein MtbC1
MDPVMTEAIVEAVVWGDSESAVGLMGQALNGGEGPDEILNQGLVPAMKRVGARFEVREFFVPEMMDAAIAMQAGLGLPKPGLSRSGSGYVGKVLIGTVKGDLHDIGKAWSE